MHCQSLACLGPFSLVDTHLFASPGHSMSFFVFPVVPKAPNCCSAGVWLLCTCREDPEQPRPLKLEPVARQRLLMGALSVFGSLSAHRKTEGTILASLAQCVWDSTADLFCLSWPPPAHGQSWPAPPQPVRLPPLTPLQLLSSAAGQTRLGQTKGWATTSYKTGHKSFTDFMKSQNSFYLSFWVFSLLHFWLSPHVPVGETEQVAVLDLAIFFVKWIHFLSQLSCQYVVERRRFNFYIFSLILIFLDMDFFLA